MKHAYHEIELTRRCNSTCAHCLRGKARALDIAEEYLDTYFSKVTHIYCLTLTGGEVTLVPKLVQKTLDYAKKYNTQIDFVGITTNGLYISDNFINAWNNWRKYTIASGLDISQTPFHKPANKKVLEKLAEAEIEYRTTNNALIIPSGRAENLLIASKDKMVVKPYWLLNGWVMEPTYLNAKGNIVGIDGSYEEQDHYILGSVADMDYSMFNETYDWDFGNHRWGILGNWKANSILEVAKMGLDGPTRLPDNWVRKMRIK
jgi:hypothetical protein